MKTVLVTRPEPGASKTAAMLAKLGFDPVVLPLTEIQLLPYSIPDDQSDATLISSVQAVRALPQSLPSHFLTTPLFAVGAASCDAAKQAGFLSASHYGADAEALVKAVCINVPRGSRLLYLCGKVRRPNVERELIAAGYLLSAIEVYNTVPISYQEAVQSAIFAGRHIDMVFATSVQAALGLNLLAPTLYRSHILCLSQRIADALVGVEPAFIHVTKVPDEESLLNLAMQLAKLR